MNQQALIEAISIETGLQTTTIKLVLDAQATTVRRAMDEGKSVLLSGIGRLTRVDRAPRTGRNPQTGEPVPIPARQTVKMTPAAELVKNK
jgi:DNA-binding protein HU-beta